MADFNILIRGQSNALLFCNEGGADRLRQLVSSSTFQNVTMLYAWDSSANTINSGTAFMDWESGGEKASFLQFINNQSAATKSRPTLTLWMHNEYEQGNGSLTGSAYAARIRSDASSIRSALGQGASTTPYLFAAIRYPYGGNFDAVNAGWTSLANDSSFNASITYSTSESDIIMNGGPESGDNSSHVGHDGALKMADKLAPLISDIMAGTGIPNQPTTPPNQPTTPVQARFFEDFSSNTKGKMEHLWGDTGKMSFANGEARMAGSSSGLGLQMLCAGASTCFGNGMFRIRAKMTGGLGSGSGPALVLWPADDIWPGSEIDIGEINGGNQTYMATHYRGGDGRDYANYFVVPGNHDYTVYHDYAAFLQTNKITYYVDNVVIGEDTDNPAPDYANGGVNHSIGFMNRSAETTITVDELEWIPEATVLGTGPTPNPTPTTKSITISPNVPGTLNETTAGQGVTYNFTITSQNLSRVGYVVVGPAPTYTFRDVVTEVNTSGSVAASVVFKNTGEFIKAFEVNNLAVYVDSAPVTMVYATIPTTPTDPTTPTNPTNPTTPGNPTPNLPSVYFPDGLFSGVGGKIMVTSAGNPMSRAPYNISAPAIVTPPSGLAFNMAEARPGVPAINDQFTNFERPRDWEYNFKHPTQGFAGIRWQPTWKRADGYYGLWTPAEGEIYRIQRKGSSGANQQILVLTCGPNPATIPVGETVVLWNVPFDGAVNRTMNSMNLSGYNLPLRSKLVVSGGTGSADYDVDGRRIIEINTGVNLPAIDYTVPTNDGGGSQMRHRHWSFYENNTTKKMRSPLGWYTDISINDAIRNGGYIMLGGVQHIPTWYDWTQDYNNFGATLTTELWRLECEGLANAFAGVDPRMYAVELENEPTSSWGMDDGLPGYGTLLPDVWYGIARQVWGQEPTLVVKATDFGSLDSLIRDFDFRCPTGENAHLVSHNYDGQAHGQPGNYAINWGDIGQTNFYANELSKKVVGLGYKGGGMTEMGAYPFEWWDYDSKVSLEERGRRMGRMTTSLHNKGLYNFLWGTLWGDPTQSLDCASMYMIDGNEIEALHTEMRPYAARAGLTTT